MQAKANTMRMTKDAFAIQDRTSIYWICNGGALINIKGTIILIDPLLEGFDMPLLSDVPLSIDDVDHVDAVLITHCDNDHFSKETLLGIQSRCRSIHTTRYVASLCEEIGLTAQGHEIGESFKVNGVDITLTPADHAWQNESVKYSKIRHYEKSDFCGFLIKTSKGNIYMPGDSRLLKEQLVFEDVKVVLLDISDSRWHIGQNNIPILANAYIDADLIPIHWGCVASDMPEFNGDPDILYKLVKKPERIRILALGEPYEMG